MSGVEKSFTVGELKELLKDLPDDLPILSATDEEGNGYKVLTTLEEGYLKRSNSKRPRYQWDGDEMITDYEVKNRKLSEESLAPHTKVLIIN